MQKRILIVAMVVVMVACMSGCREQAYIDVMKQEISEWQVEKQALETEVAELNNAVIEKKEENGTAKYVLTLEIKQSHISLDISEYLKDSMNAMEIQIPVDKEYYDSVEVGQDIMDEFRMGSFIYKGTFGNFKVTVTDKEIQ